MATDLKRLHLDRITATEIVRLQNLMAAGYDRTQVSVKRLRRAVARGLRRARNAQRA